MPATRSSFARSPLENAPALRIPRRSIVAAVVRLRQQPCRRERSRSPHAVLDLSARAHGLDPAHSFRPVRGGLVRRAHPDLYGRPVRHRRHRHGEDLVADDVRHEQAAIRQAGSSELHHGRGQQRRQARGLVRSSQHPAVGEHAARSRRARIPARRRHPDRAPWRPPQRLARLPPADELRGAGRAQDLDRCVRDLRIHRAAGAAGVCAGAGTGNALEGDLAVARSGRRAVPPRHRRRGHVGQSHRRGRLRAHAGGVGTPARVAASASPSSAATVRG